MGIASRRRGRRPALAAPCVLAALATLALGGCGGTGPAPTPIASTGSSSTARATRPGATSSASSTSSPSSTSETTTTTSTTAALPGSGRPVVTIGDKNFTEQFVLGQLYQKALEAQGFSVDISQNIGAPAVIRQALNTGSLAMYPEYLDVFNATIAHLRDAGHTRGAAERAGRRWARRHGLRLLVPTPFSDTNGIAVTVAAATRHRLRTLADLTHVAARLVIGGAAQFEKARPGLPALARVYGVTPASFLALAVGDQYGDLDDGTVGAAYVNTTDGQLATGDYRVLSDPRRIFGFGNVVPVLSSTAAAKEGPAFAATVDRVDRTLTLSTMRALNNAVDVAGENPADVAEQYLETHGLLDPLRGR